MTTRVLKFVAVLAGIAGGLAAQPQPGGRIGSGFQQAGMLGQPGGRGGTAVVPWISQMDLAVAGKPFSATEERKTTQTLADGTVIENSDSDLIYRDSQGRTRVERTVAGKTTIRIVDPVGRFSVMLDPSSKTAIKSALAGAGPRVARGGGPAPNAAPVTASDKMAMEKLAAGQVAGRLQSAYQTASNEARQGSEDLGVQAQNGVPAQGTRNTQVIPAGAIGNSRDIRVVYDRWYSSDLHMVVKSVNSDPRFGTTSYQLINISQAEPDAALFLIPGEYTVSDPRQ